MENWPVDYRTNIKHYRKTWGRYGSAGRYTDEVDPLSHYEACADTALLASNLLWTLGSNRNHITTNYVKPDDLILDVIDGFYHDLSTYGLRSTGIVNRYTSFPQLTLGLETSRNGFDGYAKLTTVLRPQYDHTNLAEPVMFEFGTYDINGDSVSNPWDILFLRSTDFSHNHLAHLLEDWDKINIYPDQRIMVTSNSIHRTLLQKFEVHEILNFWRLPINFHHSDIDYLMFAHNRQYDYQVTTNSI